MEGSVPLKVQPPTSEPLAVWRAPLWQRIVFPVGGIAMMALAFWPHADEPYQPLWQLAAMGLGSVWYALRPKLMLFTDAVYIRGHILSRVIPIQEITTVRGGYYGLDIGWGEDSVSLAPTIGEQNVVSWLPGDDSREVDMRQLILSTRDSYLTEHNLTARPDPQLEYERQRREFRERGWVEHNPPLVDRRKEQHDA